MKKGVGGLKKIHHQSVACAHNAFEQTFEHVIIQHLNEGMIDVEKMREVVL